jgi:hypothetical protein
MIPDLVKAKPEDVKVGDEISLHGTVTEIREHTGRDLYRRGNKYCHAEQDKRPKDFKFVSAGHDGLLFVTEQHTDGYFVESGASVFIISPERRKALAKLNKQPKPTAKKKTTKKALTSFGSSVPETMRS